MPSTGIWISPAVEPSESNSQVKISGFGNFDEYGRDIIDESDEYNEEIEYNEYDYKQGEDDRDAETVISIIKTIIEIGIYNNDEIASYCLSNSIIDSYPVLSKESYNNCRSNVKILDYKLLFSKLKWVVL